MWFLSDNLYSADNLKTALKKIFISYKSIFDCLYATEIGAKLSFSVIIILEISFCIFINYNEVEMQTLNCDMFSLFFHDQIDLKLQQNIM